MNIRPAQQQDLPAVQRLIRSSFDQKLHPYITATQVGAQAFLAIFVGYSSLFPERTYFIAENDSAAILGYAEFRLLEGHIGFLSYICVTPAARGQGIATQLIKRYLRERPEVTMLQLDVFADNTAALSLYNKLGFREEGQTTWLLRSINQKAESSRRSLSQGLSVDNLPVALAMQESYGFSEMQVRFRGESLRVGRMGETVLRCFEQKQFEDIELHIALQGIFPALREAMFIASVNRDVALPLGGEINRSIRMTWYLPQSLRREI